MTNRIDWIDWAKAICIFLMVCGHSPIKPYFHDFIYLFHMPVFFTISGYLYKYRNFKKLFFTLLIPSILWSCINYPWYLYGIIKQGQTLSLENIITQPLLGLVIHDFKIGIPTCGAFWFVLALFIIRLIHQSIHKYTFIEIAVLLLCISIAFISDQNPQKTYLFLIQRATIAYPFFYLGIILKERPYILSYLNKHSQSISLISLLTLVLYSSYFSSFDLYTCKLNNPIAYYFIGITGFIFIYITSTFLKKAPKAILNISNGTLAILGLHTVTIYALNKIDFFNHFIFKGEILAILTMIILYLPIIFILKRFPILVGKLNKNQH